MFFHNWEKNTCDWEECNDTEISYQNFKVKLVLFCSPLSARTRRFLKTTEMSFFLCDNYIGRKKNNYWVVTVKSVFIHILICSRNVIKIVFH